MLDGILGRGFGSKCKSLIKPTRTRIDVLRRRKEATQRFLKGNLAQLLGNGLDINAYGRTEEYLAGLDILSCYDFIEQSCEYILKQLSVMQKQSKCPEECREAVGSLMFAAAWFSDLPELRDLRDMFQDRYGSSLEHFVNQKFVEKLALRPPTMEKKIKLLQDVASEFLIKWDSRGFEQRMANPSASAQDQSEKYRSIHDHDNKYNLPTGKEAVTKTDKQNYSSQERSELTTDRHRVHNDGEGSLLKRNDLDRQFFSRKELTGNNHKQPFMGTGQTTPKSNNYDIPFPARQGFTDGKPYTGTEQTTLRRDNYDIPFRTRGEFTDSKHELSSVSQKDTASNGVSPGSSSCGRISEFVNGGYEVHKDSMNSVPKKDGRGTVCDGKPEAPGGVPGAPGRHDGKDVSSAGYNDFSQSNTANSTRKVRQEEERDGLKPHSSNALPPPYIKSRDKLVPPPYIKSIESKRGVNAEPKHPSSDYDGVPMSHSMRKREDNAARRSERIRGEADHANYEEHVVGPSRVNSHRHEKDLLHQDDILLPKPRSIRRKHSKSSSSNDDLGNFEEAAGHAKRNSSSRRRDNSSRRGLQILFDDERHQKDEEERMIDKLLLHYSKKPSTCDPEKVRRKSRKAPNAGEKTPRYDSRDGPDVQAAMGAPPTRSISLPHDQTAPTEAVKVYTRANSFQPDKPAGHVHPKLPDYDDLAARFAALRGR